MMATMTASRANELLVPELRSAWLEYLGTTYGLLPDEYEDVEPHAWLRLEQKLEQIEARRRALAAPARRTDTAEGSSPAGAHGSEDDGA